jgi:deazaflavin-dependent oxidoreductase (nitroreductase family)
MVNGDGGPYRLGLIRRLVNVVVRIGVWTGLAPRRFHLLTVRGRRSGKPRSTPIIVLTLGEERWLVAPYGEREWVKNARAAGRVTLRRAHRTETITVEEVGALQAASVLKHYLSETPITRPFFTVTPDAPLADFVREAPRHPVFRLGQVSARSALRQ